MQDALYLREFARALSIAAARAPEDDWIVMFNEHAAGALKVERALHEGFFKEFGLTPDEVAATPLAPTNLAYTSYLLAVAYGAPFHEALAALLPCYWIYWEVGKALERAGSPDPLYARWIATYASDEFGDVVRAVLAVTDAIADAAGARRARRDAPPLPHDQPLRVDVLGHGLAPRGVAASDRIRRPLARPCQSRRHG